jgi:hypothetical protein
MSDDERWLVETVVVISPMALWFLILCVALAGR